MRPTHSHIWTHKVESHRIPDLGQWSSQNGDAFGAFQFSYLRVIFSSDLGWEHASVSTVSRCPTWEEMCRIKELFWEDEEVVVQYHPKKSDYVNYHPHCLHLWRPTGVELPIPPSIMVGPKI